MAVSDPATDVPTPTGTLQGVAAFSWDGSAWQPAGRAGPAVATPTGVLRGVAAFNGGPAWQPAGRAQPGVATPSGVLDGVAVYTWSGAAWVPAGGQPTPSTPSGALRGVAAFSWDGAAWQPAGQAGPSVATPYGVLDGVAMFGWIGSAWAATGAPSLSLDFMTPGTLDPRITFTRASTATYFDSSGVMQTAGYNFLFPSVLAVSTWTANGSVALGGSITAPDGTTSTTALISATDTSNTIRAYSLVTPVSLPTSTASVVSVYMRRGNANGYIQVNCSGAAGVAYFDLTNGTGVVGADLAAGLTGKSVSITPAANGWYRTSFMFTTPVGGGPTVPYLGPCTTVSATGDNRASVGVVGQGVYAWGAQVEQGSTASPYIPTTTAANGAPRWDYDPVTHALRGLLIEEARTNLILQSGNYANAAWQANGSTVTGNQVAAPDGTITAARLALAAVSASGQFSSVNQTLTTPVNAIYTFSVWLRGNAGGEQVYLSVTPNGVLYYSTPRLTLTTAWQRYTLTTPVTLTAAAWSFVTGVDFRDAAQGTTPAQTIYAWGAQVEQAAFPTSYIPTTAAAVTRACDRVVIPPANMGFYVSPVGSWFAEFISSVPTPANLRIIGGAYVGGPLEVYTDGNNASTYDGVGVVGTANVFVTNTVAKAASTWGANVGTVCLNGGVVASVGTMTNGFPGAAASGVGILQIGSSDGLTGYICRVRYWPRVLSNTELQAVTT